MKIVTLAMINKFDNKFHMLSDDERIETVDHFVDAMNDEDHYLFDVLNDENVQEMEYSLNVSIEFYYNKNKSFCFLFTLHE